MVELNFEVQDVETTSYGPIPAGEYDGEIVSADIKQNKSDNKMLVIEIQTDKGRVWDNLNLWHSNPKAVEIAKERFSLLGKSLGMSRIEDTENLLAKRVRVRIGIQRKNPDFNEVLGYEAPAAAPTAAPTPTAAQADETATPAWSA